MSAIRSISLLIVFVLVANLLAACATGAAPTEEVVIVDTETPPPPTETMTPTSTVDMEATADAQSTADALLTAEAQETADAQASATESAEETQSALDKQATATQAMAIKQTATAETILQATAQADVMAGRVEMLLAEGVIADTQGKYVRLDDFDESWAQIDWFQWWPTEHEVENFAIRTDVAWSSASDTANWYTTGCGFVFGLDDNKNFHIARLRLDGFVTLLYWLNGNGNWIAQRPAGKISTPDGEAEILMVVYENRVTFYVDGEEKLSEHAGLLKPGVLAMTLSSGTNKDYGTRCKMTDIDLWIFE